MKIEGQCSSNKLYLLIKILNYDIHIKSHFTLLKAFFPPSSVFIALYQSIRSEKEDEFAAYNLPTINLYKDVLKLSTEFGL
jgi:hypothetical protein